MWAQLRHDRPCAHVEIPPLYSRLAPPRSLLNYSGVTLWDDGRSRGSGAASRVSNSVSASASAGGFPKEVRCRRPGRPGRTAQNERTPIGPPAPPPSCLHRGSEVHRAQPEGVPSAEKSLGCNRDIAETCVVRCARSRRQRHKRRLRLKEDEQHCACILWPLARSNFRLAKSDSSPSNSYAVAPQEGGR